jgi:primosomal replication protein N
MTVPSNLIVLAATLVERDALRYTPAGVPMLNARLAHHSDQHEADAKRTVEFELAAVFAGSLAQRASRLDIGSALTVKGFLAPRRRQSKSLVLHVGTIELNDSKIDEV